LGGMRLDLAAGYDRNTAVVTEGALFRVAAALGAAAALLLYEYVDGGSVPDLFEPLSYPEKIYSLIAEAVAALAGLALLHVSTTRVVRGVPVQGWV
jgi:hypothetical protein